jgi:hypothetical protein
MLLAVLLRITGSQMYPFFILVYIWIAFYILFVAMLIRRESTTETHLVRRGMHLVGVIALAILIRSVFLGLVEHISLDTLWYVDFGKFMQMGKTPYVDFYFPYPPVFAYFIFAIMSVYPYVDGFRILAIVMDAAVVIVIWKLVKRHIGIEWASTAAMAYALLPISIIESGWNGHFEPIVNLFLLLSLWFLMEQKYKTSGALLGLAAATKIYPLLVFPLLVSYTKGWKNRLDFTISTGLAGFSTFIPLIVLSWIGSPGGLSSGSQGSPGSGLFESFLGFVFTLSFSSVIISIAAVIGIGVGVIHIMRQISRNNPATTAKTYYIVTLVLGVVLILMGFIAGFYPFFPSSRLVYWRYPLDVGFVRGVTAVCVGLLIIAVARDDWTKNRKRSISLNALLVLVGATVLLIISMANQVFYGWYLLWSIPFFLLMRDRKLGYTVILCLLLVYPSYTHDNFATLGFEEIRYWEDEFDIVDDWSIHVNILDNFVNASQVSNHIDSDGTHGRFWFDTRNITDQSYLSNVSFSYTRSVVLGFEDTTEFVARITSSWDPPFGRYADISLDFEGVDGYGESINGSIILRSSIFTNLTYILWRYAFMNVASPSNNGTISLLNLTIYPIQRVMSSYQIDFFYTTYAGPLNPVYFLIIPSLIALALTAFTILHLVFQREQKINSIYTKSKNNMKHIVSRFSY